MTTAIASNGKLREGLAHLPGSAKVLIGAYFTLAVLALALGVIAAVVVALDEAGWIEVAPLEAFQILTLHATTVFYYWMYFVQVGVMLALVLIYTKGARLSPGLRAASWGALALMVAGWTLNVVSVSRGAAILYAAPVVLANDFQSTEVFYFGYILLALGLFCAGYVGAAVTLQARRDAGTREWPAVAFAAFLWHALLMVAAVVSLLANIPAAQIALGGEPSLSGFNYTMSWSVYFHNMHYLPLLSTVLVWYTLAEATTGIKSIFSERFSKIVFSLYLFLVPPTSLYHLFLEPEVSAKVKLVGSMLALFISVPTLAVFLIIVTSLQACANGQGSRGVFGWLERLPWRNPAFAAIAMSTVCAMAGGALANVVIQEKFASLLSDTFMVPGYFHFLTVGTVTLTFLGALVYMVPALTGHRLALPSVASALPYVLVAGVYIFGLAGVAAGYAGAPRRAMTFEYGGAAPASWESFMAAVGIGALVMAAALLAYVVVLAMTALKDVKFGRLLEELPVAGFAREDAAGQRAWFGVVAIGLFLAAMYVATAAAVWIMKSLPIVGG